MSATTVRGVDAAPACRRQAAAPPARAPAAACRRPIARDRLDAAAWTPGRAGQGRNRRRPPAAAAPGPAGRRRPRAATPTAAAAGQRSLGFPNRPPRAPWPEPGERGTVHAHPQPTAATPERHLRRRERPGARPQQARRSPPVPRGAGERRQGPAGRKRAAPHARRRAGGGGGAHRPRPHRRPDRHPQWPRRGAARRAAADAGAVGASQSARRRLLDRARDARDAMGRQRPAARSTTTTRAGAGRWWRAGAGAGRTGADGVGAHGRPRRARRRIDAARSGDRGEGRQQLPAGRRCAGRAGSWRCWPAPPSASTASRSGRWPCRPSRWPSAGRPVRARSRSPCLRSCSPLPVFAGMPSQRPTLPPSPTTTKGAQ